MDILWHHCLFDIWLFGSNLVNIAEIRNSQFASAEGFQLFHVWLGGSNTLFRIEKLCMCEKVKNITNEFYQCNLSCVCFLPIAHFISKKSISLSCIEWFANVVLDNWFWQEIFNISTVQPYYPSSVHFLLQNY